MTELARILADINWINTQLNVNSAYEAELEIKLTELKVRAAALGCPQYTSNGCENEIIPNATGCGCSSQ